MANVGSASSGKTLIGAGVGASPTYADIGTNSGLTAHGVVLSQGNSAFTTSGPGTNGYVLTSNGGASDPTFQSIGSIPGSGSLILIQSQLAAASASVDFTSLGSYSAYFLTFAAVSGNNNVRLLFQFSTTGGASWDVTNYLTGINYYPIDATTANNLNSTTSAILTGPISNARSASGQFFVYGLGGYPYMNGSSSWLDGTLGTRAFSTFGGELASLGINAFRFIMSSGNITGRISLYGIKTL